MKSDQRARELFREALESPPAGLLSDIDGTLSRISDHPSQAVIEPEVQQALKSLADRVALVAAVSGRSATDARRIVALDDLVYSGNHGMELWRDGTFERSPLAERFEPAVHNALSEFREVSSLRGLFIEDKGLTASIHYRETQDPSVAREEILAAIGPIATQEGLTISEGRMVIELRPPVELNKGTSSLELIEEYDLAGGVFLGDDVTDVDAFIAFKQRREETGKPFYAIGVWSPESPDVVVETADALVNGVDGVLTLLRGAYA